MKYFDSPSPHSPFSVALSRARCCSWLASNRAGYRRLHLQLSPCIKQRIMLGRRLTPNLHYHQCCIILLVCLAYPTVFVQSVALRSSSLSISSLPVSSSSFLLTSSSLEKNSTKPMNQNVLNKKTLVPSKHLEDKQNEYQTNITTPLLRLPRAAEDFPNESHKHTVAIAAQGKDTKNKFYQKSARYCGKRFIGGYNLLNKTNEIPNDKIFTSMCTLRKAFFDCLKTKTSRTSANEFERIKSNKSKSRTRNKSKTKKIPISEFPNRQKRFQKNLADAIWATRLCLFENNVWLK